MPVITAIEQQKRTTTRYSIYLDNTYAFSLSDLDLATSGLRTGQELTDQEVQAWQKRSVEDKAYQVALRYLGYRLRSGYEVRTQLVRKGHEPDVADCVVERLSEHGLIDDRKFAEAWLADRLALKPRSRRALEQELAQRGVARDVIEQALTTMGDEAHEQMLAAIIEKKLKQSQYRDQDKLIGYLMRQGFVYDQIKKALARLDD